MYNELHPVRAFLFLGFLNVLTGVMVIFGVLHTAIFEAVLFTSLGYAAGNTVLKRHNAQLSKAQYEATQGYTGLPKGDSNYG